MSSLGPEATHAVGVLTAAIEMLGGSVSSTLLSRSHHREHRPRRHGLHQAPAGRDGAQRILERDTSAMHAAANSPML